MKKTKILSLLLSLSLFCTLIAPGTIAHAEVEPKPDNGMKIGKTATAKGDGTYTIKLEAFATGEKTTQTTDVPTDIVLVLDQSGSMGDPIGGYTYTAYRKDAGWGSNRNYHNDEYYPLRHNDGSGNLWHKLNDNEYVAVSVEQQMGYAAISDWNNGDYYSNQNNLYCLVNGEYKKVSVSYKRGNYEYDVDGKQIGSGSWSWKSPTFDNGYAPLYQSVKKYTYSYTLNEVTTVIEESVGDGSSPDTQFYSKDYDVEAGDSRLSALQNAATTFVNAVATKAAGKDGNIDTAKDNIDHRIAVVGFADEDNTGVFIGNSLKRYQSAAAGVYGTALQDMSTTAGKKNVTASINKLTANGATRTDLGLKMANGILNANPVPQGETRNRVVIVFTDGSPTSGNGFEREVAQSAIDTAKTIKDGKTTVYSIGVFPGADASTAGEEPNRDYYDDWTGPNNYTEAEMSAACNWFMQKVSSNNGTPRTPSYYLSAGDAASLNSIFQQISSNIGGSSTTLDDKTVVKDIISPYFTLPENATESNIELKTYHCTGKDAKGDYTWSENAGAMGAQATINGDQVSVTGFNFSENWCGTETNAQGTTYRGNKLVISFNVKPKAGFLGGNDVYTNTNAGIYENSNAKEPIMTFDRPTVNVPIKNVTVKADDKNVYLKGEVTADQLKNGAKVSVGGVDLDLSQATNIDKPYGLEKWQTEYVNIAVKVKDEADNEIPAEGLKNLTEDTTYTVEVTVAPQKVGTTTPEKGNAATAKTGANDPKAKINVFKPELTFKDSTAYYGETVPADNDYSSNRVGEEKWMHGDTASTDTGVTMLGSKPTLDITYAPNGSKLDNGKYTKQDVPVSATVKIGTTDVNQYTKFVHQNCTPDCGWAAPTTPNGDPAFLIHVKTCTLEIKKTGGAAGESYVFDVYKGNEKYSEVTIEGNTSQTLVELPVGNYTIEENTGWSWRYTADNGSGAELTAQYPTGSITCSNTKTKDQWLNGFSKVRRNIFGKSN